MEPVMLATLDERIMPARTALVIIDMQKDLVLDGFLCHQAGRDLSATRSIIPNLVRLLDGARAALARIDECVTKLRETAGDTTPDAAPEVIEKFTAALDDDLNVSSAWGAVFDWVRDCNRRLAENTLEPNAAAAELAAWERIDTVLGVGKPEEEAPAELTALLEERAEARAAKDFARADAIRDELAEQGWAIEDTAKGARLKRL